MATGHGKPPWRLDVSFGLGGKVPLGLAGDGAGGARCDGIGQSNGRRWKDGFDGGDFDVLWRGEEELFFFPKHSWVTLEKYEAKTIG